LRSSALLETIKTSIGIATGMVTLIGVLRQVAVWLGAQRRMARIRRGGGSRFYTTAEIEQALQHYVKPDFQDIDPDYADEPGQDKASRVSSFSKLDEVLSETTQQKYFIILGGSGMGKTSLCLNYYARSRPTARRQLHVLPLGKENIDDVIQQISDKQNAVIFLDGLDEDQLAIVDHRERLDLLFRQTREFNKVILTCRTQFFPSTDDVPQQVGIIRFGARRAGDAGAYELQRFYLAPFNDKQIRAYLRKRFPRLSIRTLLSRNRLRARRVAIELPRKIPRLSVRPMLLAHLEDLVGKSDFHYSFEFYQEMIDAWIRREEGRTEIRKAEPIKRFCKELALDIFTKRIERRSESVSAEEFEAMARSWRVERVTEW
jgi:predicted NACHT family NTPase